MTGPQPAPRAAVQARRPEPAPPSGAEARPQPTRAKGGLRPARLRAVDALLVGGAGLRTRPLRAVLSALGIAIGIAAMLSVVGISASSKAELDRALAALGTNLLTAGPGSTMAGGAAKLPPEAVSMVARIGPVQSSSAVGVLDRNVYRNRFVPDGQTGGIAVMSAREDLLSTLRGGVRSGRWLTSTVDGPVVVLGHRAAELLDIRRPGPRVWLGGQWFGVAGILDPLPLAPELDSAALVDWSVATKLLGFDGSPTTIYTRSVESRVEAVRGVLAATVNPEAPNEVKVSRPSDALFAARASDAALNGLLLGLGAVALLVGGVGVANTMVISVLERRAEIGLRRSLGATRGHVRVQFLAESLLLSALGGVAGVLLGAGVTAGYAVWRAWPVVVPVWAMAGGVGATLAIGGIAGLYPAMRAARLSPTEALAS